MISEKKAAKELANASADQIEEILGDKEVPTETAMELYEGNFNQGQAQELARHSLDYLSALANPEGHTANFPPTYQAAWALILTLLFKPRDFSKLALGLPRGFGKTAFMKLVVLFIILFTNKKFIFIQAANAKLAANILADIVDFLDHPNIRAVFGDWRLGITKDTQELVKFGFRGRNIVIAALGESGSPRGLNLKNARPDVMIFDDIQTREDADSKLVSEAIYKKLLGTTMKAKAPTGCLYLFLANMYPTEHSILRKLKHNSQWIKFIAGGILADGTSLWEEVQPLEQLLAEYQNDLESGHPEIFYSEVLNDETANINTLIDVTKIPNVSIDQFATKQSIGNFIVIDPSNDKANSDHVAIGQFSTYDGVPVLKELIDDRLSPSDTIRKALQLAMRTNTRLIVVEGNAYQYSLLHWFNVISTQLGLSGFFFEPIYSGKAAKNNRIMEMFKGLTSTKPEVLISDKVRSLVLSQISGFNYLKQNNVDNILDLLTYAPRILKEFPDKLIIETYIVPEEEDTSELTELRCLW